MRLNPFAGLDKPRQVWAWGMYDLANQSFQLVINTLLFGVYIQQVVAATPDAGKTAWANMVSLSLVVVVVLSPIVGAIVDAGGRRHRLLIGSGFVAAAATAGLTAVGPGQLWLAALLYIPAAILVGLGENVLAAYLPDLATPRTMGRVSAVGWTMSYVGAVVLQVCVLVAATVLGWSAPDQWRPLFVFAGVWFALGILPAALYLRDARPPGGAAPPRLKTAALAGESFRRLGATMRDARRFGQLSRFFLAFFVYSLGVQTAVYFAGSIAVDFGFGTRDLFLLTLLLSVTAGAAAALLGMYQDRLGMRVTLGIVLGVWVLTTLSIAGLYALKAPAWALWISAVGIGLGFGGVGTASRAVVGCFTPPARSAEFFGLWGMVYKGAGVVGPAAFAYAWVGLGPAAALLVLAGFFVAGLVLMTTVDEKKGLEQARAAV